MKIHSNSIQAHTLLHELQSGELYSIGRNYIKNWCQNIFNFKFVQLLQSKIGTIMLKRQKWNQDFQRQAELWIFFRKRLAVFYVALVSLRFFPKRKRFGLHHNQICPPVFKVNHQNKTSPFAHAAFIVFSAAHWKSAAQRQSTEGEERWGACSDASSCLFLLPPRTRSGQTLTLKKGFKQPLVALNCRHPPWWRRRRP